MRAKSSELIVPFKSCFGYNVDLRKINFIVFFIFSHFITFINNNLCSSTGLSVRSWPHRWEGYHWPNWGVVSMLTFVVTPEVGGRDQRDHDQPWHQAVLDQSPPPPTWRIIFTIISFVITIFGGVTVDKFFCSCNPWEFVWKNVAELSLLSIKLVSLMLVLCIS